MQKRRHFALQDEDDGDDVPLHRKQGFGAGLKRKRVEFVPAKDADSNIKATILDRDDNKSGILAGDLYASIVLSTATSASKKAAPSPIVPDSGELAKPEDDELSTKNTTTAGAEDPANASVVCQICSLPITTSIREHEASLAHQVSMTHSHPPSALDRSRMGLRTLAAQGWDPDARTGLGRGGEGARFPIKVTPKEDTLGIGAEPPSREQIAAAVAAAQAKKPLSAKERKAMDVKDKKRAERLQAEIFGSVDVDRYLRGDGTGNS